MVLVLKGTRETDSRALLCALFPALMEWSAMVMIAGVRQVTKALAAKRHFVELVVLMAVPALCPTYAFVQRVLRDPLACRLYVGLLAGMAEIVSARESAAVHMGLRARDARRKAA